MVINCTRCGTVFICCLSVCVCVCAFNGKNTKEACVRQWLAYCIVELLCLAFENSFLVLSSGLWPSLLALLKGSFKRHMQLRQLGLPFKVTSLFLAKYGVI